MKWETVKVENNNPEFPLDFCSIDNKSDSFCVVYFSQKNSRPHNIDGATRMYGGDYVIVPMMWGSKISEQIKTEMEAQADLSRHPKGHVVIKEYEDGTKDVGYLIIHHNKELV